MIQTTAKSSTHKGICQFHETLADLKPQGHCIYACNFLIYQAHLIKKKTPHRINVFNVFFIYLAHLITTSL